MPKPYSVDLRERVVLAVEKGASRRQAATQFGVAISTVARDNYGGRSATIRMTGMRHRRVAPIPLSQASIAQQ